MILRERRGQVEILTLNRPEARNAINAEVTKQLTAALDDLDKDEDLRVIILTGAGDKAFCAGMDLKAFGAGTGGSIGASTGGFAGFVRRAIPVPVIAAVNGPALAGGFELVLACDLVVAAEHAVFGIPEVKRGLLAAGGGLVRLPKRLPIAHGDGAGPDRRLDHRRPGPRARPRERGGAGRTGCSTRPSRWPAGSSRTPRSASATRASSPSRRPRSPRPRPGT